MAIKVGGTGSGGSSNVIADDNFFPDTMTRDDYFSNNPSKLKNALQVSVNGQLQQYQSSTGNWVDVTPLYEGQSGRNAPEMIIEYSSSGNSGWTTSLNTSLHKYWRWSTDGGNTWSADFVRYSAASAASGVPDPYRMEVGGNGRLQIWKDSTLIQEQDDTGVWSGVNEVFHEGNPSVAATSLNTLTGADRISYDAIKNVPTMSETVSGIAKLGSGLSIDNEGKLNSIIAAADKRTVSSELEMLALPQTNDLYIVTRTDVNSIWYLNANEDPSILANWEEGSSTGDIVSSFTGRQGDIRNGAVQAKAGDYNLSDVPDTDVTTGVKYILVRDNGQLYMEEV